jgi:hypothetical protein
LNFFWCQKIGVANRNWGDFLHSNGWHIAYNLDFWSGLSEGKKMC